MRNSMSVTRRRFCAAGALTLSSPAIIGSASAQSGVEVVATVRSEVETDVSGVEFQLQNIVNEDIHPRTLVDASGEITFNLPETGSYRVTAFDTTTESNKIPVVYSFDNVNINESGNIGEFVIPEAYETDIRFIDEEGSPVEDLPVQFRAENGTGPKPGEYFTTDSDGYTKYERSNERGVELVSPTDVEIQSFGERPQKVQTVFVTESTEFEFKISNPEQYTNSASSGSGVSGQRGLFSNNPSGGGGALSNPTNLTALGFLLSVGGIAYQLVGGR